MSGGLEGLADLRNVSATRGVLIAAGSMSVQTKFPAPCKISDGTVFTLYIIVAGFKGVLYGNLTFGAPYTLSLFRAPSSILS